MSGFVNDGNTKNATLTLVDNVLKLTDTDGVIKEVNLSSLAIDTNTDEQQLTKLGNTISLTNGGSVSLSDYVNDGNTKNASLSLVGNVLKLTDTDNVSKEVNLSSLAVDTNTKNASLTLVGNVLKLTDTEGVSKEVNLLGVGTAYLSTEQETGKRWKIGSGVDKPVFEATLQVVISESEKNNIVLPDNITPTKILGIRMISRTDNSITTEMSRYISSEKKIIFGSGRTTQFQKLGTYDLIIEYIK